MVHAGGEAHALEGGQGQAAALGPGAAAVDEGQLHVVEDAQVVDQVEGLEDEPDLLVAQAGEVLVLVGLDRRAVELDRALARRVEETEHVEQRALARARGPHDRDELALGTSRLMLQSATVSILSVRYTFSTSDSRIIVLSQSFEWRSTRPCFFYFKSTVFRCA